MEAILWDGNKQIKGELELKEQSLHFVFHDFSETNLLMNIDLCDIKSLRVVKIFDLAPNGLEIKSRGNKKNVFVVDDVEALKMKLMECLKLE